MVYFKIKLYFQISPTCLNSETKHLKTFFRMLCTVDVPMPNYKNKHLKKIVFKYMLISITFPHLNSIHRIITKRTIFRSNYFHLKKGFFIYSLDIEMFAVTLQKVTWHVGWQDVVYKIYKWLTDTIRSSL